MRISKPPAERRAELITAARRLFDLNGVENTRVSDIVREVGVAQGVFYYYFKSKDEMVSVVSRQVQGEIETRAVALLCNPKNTFCDKLAGIIELYIDLVDQFLGDRETNLGELEILLSRPDSGAGQTWVLITGKLLTLVEEGAAAGKVGAAYPRQSALVLLHGLRALAARELPGRDVIYAIAEQGLGIQKGSLVALASEPQPSPISEHS